MPLPDRDMAWPPVDLTVRGDLADWDAWYSSVPDRLERRYAGRTTDGLAAADGSVPRRSQYAAGFVGRVARWWWGQPTPAGEKRSKLHIPLAADIARTSSELLFSEPPQLVADDAAVQARLEDLTKPLRPVLLEAGELCAALGGVYLRVVWDGDVSETPWIAPVPADSAVPEFSYGILRAATFWRTVRTDGQQVWRHLERHERGRIYHGLYQGSPTQLGRPVPLQDDPETAPLAREVDDQGGLDTGAPQHLTAVYVPNVRPARAWRHLPAAAGLGQSDFQGIEGIMDALDETWSSWMRDIQQGKGRIVTAAGALTSNGPGQGASVDLDRQVYAGLNLPPTSGQLLEQIQFQIRVTEHRDTANELTEQAIRQAGYSASTFGADSDGAAAVTATEVKARQRRSMTTRARKALYWEPALAQILEALLAVEAGPRFRSGVPVDEVDVAFQDSISESPKEFAETAALLRQAEAASTETLVRMRSPELDDDQVREEVAAIMAESGRAVTDPTQLGAEEAAPVEGPVPPTA
ncbi:phage portal protein [Kitasatospora sp. NPDC056181]|uniref:phage portal protein n=1 Tax=Kitasatospora sp. NPDC056181 TaxID=3345737 RepID=UPI0035D58003